MTLKGDGAGFVRSAEEHVRTRARSARIGTDDYLDEKGWLETCDSVTMFFLTYHENMVLQLRLLLADPEGQWPDLLKFMLETDLERHFAVGSGPGTGYGPLTAAVKYAMARVMAGLISGHGWPDGLGGLSDAAFAGLWRMPGASEMETTETLKAQECLLDLVYGRYAEIVERCEKGRPLLLGKPEGADRTVVKACYLLSRMALGTADEGDRFGARSLVLLVKYDYFLYMVNEHLPANIDLLPVVLLTWLYEVITKKASPSTRDLFTSMAPRIVWDEMRALAGK